jgi:hypothetical protein
MILTSSEDCSIIEGYMKTEKQEKTKAQLVYLPLALIEKVQQAARENYRSLSGEVAYILEQYFKQQKPTEETAGEGTNKT